MQPVVVPILRAGLGFVHAAQELLPDADVGFIGISRDEETFAPKPYVNKLPESLAGRPVIVIDPMLATGGSLLHTIELLTEREAPLPIIAVCALAAPEGIERLRGVGRDRRTSSPPRSTTTSTTRPSSSPASATPATASSARRTDLAASGGHDLEQAAAEGEHVELVVGADAEAGDHLARQADGERADLVGGAHRHHPAGHVGEHVGAVEPRDRAPR